MKVLVTLFLSSIRSSLDVHNKMMMHHCQVRMQHKLQLQPRVIADGWTANLPFDLPDPGTYTLTTINTAGGGTVLDTDGNEDRAG